MNALAKARIICFLAACLALAGCQPAPVVVSTATSEARPALTAPPVSVPGPTNTPEPIHPAAPLSTPTFIPTDTLPPVAAPTSFPAPLPTVVFRKGPDVIFAGDNTQMKVVWQLEAPLASALQWGTDRLYSAGTVTTTDYSPDYQETYTLTGLRPGTKYYYRIVVNSASSTGSFYSAPEATATDLKFFAYGDTRTNSEAHNLVAGQVISSYTADPAFQTFNLAVGDLVSSGDLETSWTSEFFNPDYQNIRTVLANISFLAVMGNHEGTGSLFAKYFPMPFVADRYWSFDYGPAHVVMLDQYVAYGVGSPEYAWLANDLASSTKTWKFIVLHEPGWSAGGGHANNPTVQNEIEPLAEKYGVAIIFGGHNHYYARASVNGIQHLTVGGGGAPLYTPNPDAPNIVKASSAYSFAKIEISGNQLTGTGVTSDGIIIDTFTVTK